MPVAAADFELFGVPAHCHDLAAAKVAGDAGDGFDVDQRGAVDLPEQGGVNLIDQFLDRLADQRLDRGGLDPGVFLVADEEQHLCARDHLDALADGGLDPVEVARRAHAAHGVLRVQARGQGVQQLLDRRRGVGLGRAALGQAAADSVDGDLQPVALGRLEHVVGRAVLKASTAYWS